MATLVTAMVIGGCAQQTTPAPTPVVVLGKQGLDLSSYDKIGLDESRIEVSSTNQLYEGKENLIKGLGDPYWHVKYPKETDEAWVVVDLGRKGRLDVLAIRPRPEYPQLWDGNAAILEGSNDKKKWTPLAELLLYLGELNDQDWIAFILPENISSYRYYRLFITYPDFLSLGGLAAYGEGGKPVAEIPTKDNIPVVKPE